MNSEVAEPAGALAKAFWAVIALAAVTGACAILAARDLVYDGAYYLLAIAARGEFQLWEPARASVLILEQCFAVAGAWLGIQDLWTLGRLFSLAVTGWPVFLTALCWFVLPKGEKSWIAGPLVNLVFAIPTTSFIGIGEGTIASCLLWLAFLLVAFRIDHAWGAIASVVATAVCAFSHESAAVCLGAIAILALWRSGGLTGFPRLAALASATIAGAAAVNMLRWIIFPRSVVERGDFLAGSMGGFLGSLHAPNIPALASLVAAAAIIVPFARGKLPSAATSAAALAALLLLLLVLIATPDQTLAPSRFFAARGVPVALTTILAVVFLVMMNRGSRPARLVSRPVLAVILGLAATQAAAQTIMTQRWNSYVHDLRTFVTTPRGAISHAETMQALDPARSRFRRELLESWSVEPLSIVLAPHGRVMTVVEPAPDAPWVPYRPGDPTTLPRAPQLHWSGFSPHLAR